MNAIDWHWDYHEKFSREVILVTSSSATATFLVIGGGTVVLCASMLFTLPDVNVINNILIPGYLPGGTAILLSLPYILFTVKHAKVKSAIWKAWQEQLHTHFEETIPEEGEIEEEAKKIVKAFIDMTWTRDLKDKIFNTLLENYKEEIKKEDEEQSRVFRVLSEAHKLSVNP